MIVELILLILLFSLLVPGIVALIAIRSFFEIRSYRYKIASRDYYWHNRE